VSHMCNVNTGRKKEGRRERNGGRKEGRERGKKGGRKENI
jgi:hypothetical protein